MSSSLAPSFPVLIVDDEEDILKSMRRVLQAGGINNVICIKDSREVLETIFKEEVGVILLDLIMPNISGEELLPILHRDFPDLPIIVVTGNIDVSTAVKCMKLGAADYLVKAVEESKLIATVSKAIEIQELKRENKNLKKRLFSNELDNPEAFLKIVTNNNKIRSIFLYIESIAKTSHVVLITGETGVGKDLIAEAIHKISGRKAGPFLTINVAGLDDNMFADTLFGHRKGAFTGADQSRGGLIEKASGGTLFLDEIGDLSIASQVKLLRLLEANEYFPLGSDMTKRSEARIIVATNRNLDKLMEEEKFRKDLFYRLKTHHMNIPPLKERMDDLPLLIDHFLIEISSELGIKKPTLPPELYTLLETYHFPGNVRELKSIMFDAISRHRSGILSLKIFRDAVGQNEIPMGKEPHKPLLTFSEKLPTLNQISWILIDEALKRAKGNKSIAAGLIGITHQALSKRLNRAGK